MGSRLDGGTDYYRRTTALPSGSAYTLMMWVYLDVDTNAEVSLLYCQGAAFETRARLYLQSDGVTPAIYNGTGADTTGTALSTGTWYHLALTNETGAGNMKGYVNGVVDVSVAGNTSEISYLFCCHPSDPLDGRVAAYKIWGAALTRGEVLTEMRQYCPVRVANNVGFYPFWNDTEDEIDYSPSQTNWDTVGGTPTTTTGPPIPWRLYKSSVPYAVAAASVGYIIPPRNSIRPYIFQPGFAR